MHLLFSDTSRCEFRGWTLSPEGFDPLPTQRVPLCTILRYPFLVTDPKNFLRTPLAPIYFNFEWGTRAKKKALFLVTFKKNNYFLACFSSFLLFGMAQKINLIDLKFSTKLFV